LLSTTVFGLLLRLPYWQTIPAPFDEVNQAVYALSIAQGQRLPLVGNDAYAGPFYFYLLAGLFRLGVADPLVGRMIALLTGTLTIPLTFALVLKSGKNYLASLIAALLIAINADLILVNSHIGGTTFLLPFFTTLFLWLFLEAIYRDRVRWLIGGAIVAGLTIQSNPLGGLVVVTVWLWLLWQTRHHDTLGQWWPFWPIIAGLTILLVYSPVLLYNMDTRLDTISVLQERSYLWESDPSFSTTLNNIRRLSLQMVRQVSGTLTGSESLKTLIGIPLLYLLLMVAGLTYTTRHVSSLPIYILAPFWIIFPIFSSHYGFGSVGRFTTLLLPIWAAVIGFLLAAVLNKINQGTRRRQNLYKPGLILISLVLTAYPVISLFHYYQTTARSLRSGRALIELSRYAAAENQGEPIYISAIDEFSAQRGIPYVPHAYFLFADIHHEFLSPRQIIGRLFENPRAATFLLTDHDAAVVQEVADLKRISIAADEEARELGFGLYHFNLDKPLSKPDFVLTIDNIPTELKPAITYGDSVQLLGCDVPETVKVGTALLFTCYWQVFDDVPPDTYMTFAHLYDESPTFSLIGQDDHTLGQETYPLNAWQPDEVVQENYAIHIPADVSAAEYQISLGIYTWPGLNRLNIPDNPDNIAVIASIRIDG
jgi:hypothetical protein